MKSMPRSVIWWPNIDKQLEDRAKHCQYCCTVNDNPRRVNLTPWPYPNQPWHRVLADFAGPYLGHTYFLLVDAYSKWPESNEKHDSAKYNKYL